MRYQLISPLVVALAFVGLASAQRRKGGGGGGGDFGGDHEDSDGYGDDENDAGGSSTGDSGSGSSRPCGWLARQHAFGLPGLYYNGTLTVQHQLTDNTAWEDADEDFNDCDNNDKELKTYEYPALLLVGPTANESDSNPMHWVLRGHEPQGEGSGYYQVDFLQRWVYIRSSDFVVSNRSTLYTTDYLVDRLEDIDATDLDDETRIYWATNITSDDGKIFSASAEYVETPPTIDLDQEPYESMVLYRPGKRTSGYVTLSDVCRFGQSIVDSDDDEAAVEELRGASKKRRSLRTREYHASRSLADGTPTLWLEKGVRAEMENIGASSMTWSLNATMTRAIPWVGMRSAGCHTFSFENDAFEMSSFYPLQSDRYKEEGLNHIIPWNISVDFSLTFRGSLVRENSTTLEGERNGKLLFGRDYREFTEQATDQEDHAIGLRSKWVATVGITLAFFLILN